MSKLALLDLFSGIGGFSLGLERSGYFETVAFCEIEPYPRKVLARHWPKVPCYDDVRNLTAARLAADGIRVDAICGGFPCQDISNAGKGEGLDGERSGLWREFFRLICEIRPRYVIVENVAALLDRGLGVILGNLASVGYDAEWCCIPASFVEAEHERDRIWIVAYPDRTRELQSQGREQNERRRAGDCASQASADACLQRSQGGGDPRANDADARNVFARCHAIIGTMAPLSRSYWQNQPLLGRGVHGIPARVDRIKCLGNAVVPQIPEAIGRAIGECEFKLRQAAQPKTTRGDRKVLE